MNVAGTSQFFQPEGEDIFGANNPLGEFLNTGTFETVYVDQDIRISRTSGPLFEQLRVFVRKESGIIGSDIINNLQSELRTEEKAEVSASAALAESRLRKITDASQNIREIVTSVGVDVTKDVQQNLEEVSSAFGDAIDDVVEKVQDEVENDLNELGEALKGVEDSLDGGGTFLEAVSNVTKVATKIPQEVSKIVNDDIGNVSKSLGEALDSIVKDVQDTIEDDLEKINESLTDVQNAVSGNDEDKVDGPVDDGK